MGFDCSTLHGLYFGSRWQKVRFNSYEILILLFVGKDQNYQLSIIIFIELFVPETWFTLKCEKNNLVHLFVYFVHKCIKTVEIWYTILLDDINIIIP